MAPCQVIPLPCNLKIYSLTHLGLCLKCNDLGCELENRQMVSLEKTKRQKLKWRRASVLEELGCV